MSRDAGAPSPAPEPSRPIPGAPGGDMPGEEFRRRGAEVVEWIATYLDEVGSYPVMPAVRPGDMRARLQETPPERGEDMGRILDDFREIVVPAVTHWNHPSFHGYFAVTGSGPGILGEMLSAALNVNAMVWRSSPAATELEEHAADWVRGLLGLPSEFRGVIQDTASTSSLVALAAARRMAYPEVGEEGLAGLPAGRVYMSSEAHSSIEKAVVTLGLGRRGARAIEADGEWRMRPDRLEAAIEEDVAAGVRPVAVVATAGTTSTTSVDPLADIAQIAERHGLWLHVDAAYAGAAAMLPERRDLFRGWERAHSIVFNPHKWLFTPVDCSLLFTRRADLVRDAFSLVPEYLRTAEEGEATNLMDYGIALGRRFRALKLWFVLRYFGADGIRARLREHLALAGRFADAVDRTPGWVRVAPVPFSTVVFALDPEAATPEERDRMNLALMDAVNGDGRAFLSHTRLDDRVALRLSVGNLRTCEEHVDATWQLLKEAARNLQGSGSVPGE